MKFGFGCFAAVSCLVFSLRWFESEVGRGNVSMLHVFGVGCAITALLIWIARK